jgi:transcriptional regulator with XRE-family HTH domain
MELKAMGQRIKTARERKGYTQEQLAERLNLSVQHVSVIERGVKAPKLETFIRIANELQVNADFLLSDVLAVSAQLEANDLYERMEAVSDRDKERILKVIQVLVDLAERR